jgi:hypothetical protein
LALALVRMVGRQPGQFITGLLHWHHYDKHLFTGQDQCVHFAVLQPDDRNGSVGSLRWLPSWRCSYYFLGWFMTRSSSLPSDRGRHYLQRKNARIARALNSWLACLRGTTKTNAKMTLKNASFKISSSNRRILILHRRLIDKLISSALRAALDHLNGTGPAASIALIQYCYLSWKSGFESKKYRGGVHASK